MRIKRARTGSRWFVVQDADGGREIRHSSKATLDEAILYVESWGEPGPTGQELAALELEDIRVRLRQYGQRAPRTPAKQTEERAIARAVLGQRLGRAATEPEIDAAIAQARARRALRDVQRRRLGSTPTDAELDAVLSRL